MNNLQVLETFTNTLDAVLRFARHMDEELMRAQGGDPSLEDIAAMHEAREPLRQDWRAEQLRRFSFEVLDATLVIAGKVLQ